MGIVNTCFDYDKDNDSDYAKNLEKNQIELERNYKEHLNSFFKEQGAILNASLTLKYPIQLKYFRNNCYINSAMQILATIPEFYSWVYRNTENRFSSVNNKRELLEIFRIFYVSAQKQSSTLSTVAFMEYFSAKKKMFPVGRQGDTCEFLYAILDELFVEESGFEIEAKTLSELFCFERICDFECKICMTTWPNKINSYGLTTCRWSKQTLQENIEFNFQDYREQSNLCRKCDKHSAIEKSYKVFLPKYLYVNFIDYVNLRLGTLIKVDPLNISGFHYELIDIVVYEGNRKFGHYYVIKKFAEGAWKLVENDRVRTLGKDSLERKINIKMLCLVRRNS